MPDHLTATPRQAMTSPQGRRADTMPSLQAIPQYRFSTAEIEPSRPRSVTHNRTVSVHAFMVQSCHDGDEGVSSDFGGGQNASREAAARSRSLSRDSRT